MTERPILFSAPMVRALLDGRKTQTRRVVKASVPEGAVDAGVISSGSASNGLWWWLDSTEIEWASPIGDEFRCPYGVPGDTLWVREAWRLHERFSDVARIVYGASQGRSWTEQHEDFPIALAGERQPSMGFKPSIHMPRWASRISLLITDVRIERLCSISGPDAEAEGLKWIAPGVWSIDDVSAPVAHADPVIAYLQLWDHINGVGAAGLNPWVWAVSFKVQRP